MQLFRRLLRASSCALFLCVVVGAQTFQLVKSPAGPSGKVSGDKFVFDETRSRFVFLQDKSLIAYFEWKAPIGTHTLVAYWKGPAELKVIVNHRHNRPFASTWTPGSMEDERGLTRELPQPRASSGCHGGAYSIV